MAQRPLFLIPFVALLAAVTAACGTAAEGTSAGAAPTSSPTSSPASTHSTRHSTAASTKTVTVTVTRTADPRPTPTTTTTPAAPSFAAFAGEWSGHTKFISVSRTGRLEEHVGDGCCHPVIDMVIQLSNPHRSGASWVANGRVVSAEIHDG